MKHYISEAGVRFACMQFFCGIKVAYTVVSLEIKCNISVAAKILYTKENPPVYLLDLDWKRCCQLPGIHLLRLYSPVGYLQTQIQTTPNMVYRYLVQYMDIRTEIRFTEQSQGWWGCLKNGHFLSLDLKYKLETYCTERNLCCFRKLR